MSKPKAPAAPAGTNLKQTRRRLSVVSDNKLIEGIATIGTGKESSEEAPAAAAAYVVRAFAGFSKKGYAPYNPRKRNQDAMLMEEDKKTGTLLFGVFDGHGEAGDLVSQFFTSRLPSRLFASPKWGPDPAGALVEELDKVERTLLADSSIDTEFSGSTGVVGIIRGKTLTVANIGDSRVILGKTNKAGGPLIAESITDDHKPDRPDEKARIVKSGGRVFAVEYDDGIDGPPRVWLGHMDIPGLAMSRSLGDTVAHTAGVISAPEVTTRELTPDDKVLIWASDGLWEFNGNEETVIAAGDGTGKNTDPRKAVDALITDANARWMKQESVIDDTTVIVCYLNVPA